MSTIRFFSGGREGSGKQSIANEIMRIEFQKNGKMSSTDRYKLIMKRKMEENKKKLGSEKPQGISHRAEMALKQVAAKKAAKEAKRMRNSVIITPRHYTNGRLTKNGKIYDIAGNIIGEVNVKNGKMANLMGWSFGKYKPKSRRTDGLIEEAITKFSPFYIQQRKLEALRAAGIDPMTGQPIAQTTTTSVYGASTPINPGAFASYGEAAQGPRQNIGINAWGAQSDNVWGTFADNAWGTSTDNVWGTNSSDVWGGIGGNPFGGKSVQFFGTGNGKNYLKVVTNFIAGLLGIKNKKTADAFKNIRRARAATTRTTAPTTTTRR